MELWRQWSTDLSRDLVPAYSYKYVAEVNNWEAYLWRELRNYKYKIIVKKFSFSLLFNIPQNEKFSRLCFSVF